MSIGGLRIKKMSEKQRVEKGWRVESGEGAKSESN